MLHDWKIFEWGFFYSQVTLLDYPRALVAWEEMKQGFMLDNAKQVDFIESPLALVVALQNIFVYYQGKLIFTESIFLTSINFQ